MHNPFGEINEPLPPELKRTLAFCRCSSHCGVASKLCFSLSCLSGGALNNHIPSSAEAEVKAIAMMSGVKIREIIRQHRAVNKSRQLMKLVSFPCRCGEGKLT